MTSEKSRISSELGGGSSGRPRGSTEKSFSEVYGPDNENEEHPWDVADTLQYAVSAAAAAFETADGPKAKDEFSARRPQWRRTATLSDNGQATEIRAADETYARDRGTVRVLAHTQLAAVDRTTVDAWLDKLDGCGDLDVRSEYAELLLRTVAGGSMRVEPFWGRPPPSGPLRRLGLRSADPALLLQQYSGQPPTRFDSALQLATPITRQTFYDRQPIPEDGTICYAAAFSNIF